MIRTSENQTFGNGALKAFKPLKESLNAKYYITFLGTQVIQPNLTKDLWRLLT